MYKSDSQLQREVLEELRWEPSIDHAHIGVTAKSGVVTLSGFVPNYLQKSAAENATRRIAGVKGIAEDIIVRFDDDPKTSDSEVAERILSVFAWDVSVPDGIQVKVEQGFVTLTGAVDWNYQKQAAQKAAGKISGVRNVLNHIAVRTRVSPSDVRDRIIAAFKRARDLDAAAIQITVDGGTVKLTGNVKGWNERKIAENAAWAAPGVTKVQADIVLAS